MHSDSDRDLTAYIPTNFTDAGKLLGMFETRNAVECILLCVPLALAAISLSPFGLTGTIVMALCVLIPTGGFALIGVQDHSLFTFLRIYRLFRKSKGIRTYRGITWIHTR